MQPRCPHCAGKCYVDEYDEDEYEADDESDVDDPDDMPFE
jgi:hypothetical protein